jgi:anti-anti-sigma factor
MSAAEQQAVNRQTLTASTFVEIVDTLVNDFDVIDVLTLLTSRCVDLLAAAAAGILLADGDGRLRVIGASTEQVQLLELFQIQNEQGPCLDCYTTGTAVSATDLHRSSPWPQFAAASIRAGYPSVYAIPLRINTATVGCLNLFMTTTIEMSTADINLAQALADVASIAIVHNHASRQGDNDHYLGPALDSRIAVEQAKGMIAEHASVDTHDAFVLLRTHARANGQGITAFAEALVAGTVGLTTIHRPDIAAPTGAEADTACLGVESSSEHATRVVRLTGVLDLATREMSIQACLPAARRPVEVDLADVTWMDCSGYSGLMAARLMLEQHGGTLTLHNANGQPAHLLSLLAALDTDSPVTPSTSPEQGHAPPA